VISQKCALRAVLGRHGSFVSVKVGTQNRSNAPHSNPEIAEASKAFRFKHSLKRHRHDAVFSAAEYVAKANDELTSSSFTIA
jgi:hypothetical protein